MIDANVFDLQRIDIGTCLLVQEVLLHGLINLFTSHFVLEITTKGFVHLVHVHADVLTGEDGWRSEDSHRLTSVVVGIRRVSARLGVKAIVDSEVANFVVPGDCFSWGSLVVLDLVKTLEVDEVVVNVVNRVGWVRIHRRRQQLGDHGKPSVLSVDGGGNRLEFVQQVCRVPILTENGVRAAIHRFFRGTNVVGERLVGFCFGAEGIANTGRGDGIGARQNGAVFVDHVHLRVVEDAGFVRVTFGHDDVSVGFDDIERTLLDKVHHGFVKDELHRHEIVVLRLVEVLVHHTGKSGREGVVIAVRCIRSIGL